MQSQVNPVLNGEVLRTFHKWTIERTVGGIVITDGWVTYWVTVYDDGSWRADAEFSHAGIISWLNKHCANL